MTDRCDETGRLLRQVQRGEEPALDELFARYRKRLIRMVRLRLDRRLQNRIGVSDVVQDAHLEAVQRLASYLADPQLPFFLWLRLLTGQKLIQLHRRHLVAQRRDVRDEVHLHRGPLPGATSAALARQLIGDGTAPSQAAIRAERKLALERALNAMDPIDREILALRHFEQLTNAEAAAELGLQASAASKRYQRALKRLGGAMASLADSTERAHR